MWTCFWFLLFLLLVLTCKCPLVGERLLFYLMRFFFSSSPFLVNTKLGLVFFFFFFFFWRGVRDGLGWMDGMGRFLASFSFFLSFSLFFFPSVVLSWIRWRVRAGRRGGVMRRIESSRVELAGRMGIHGFCHHSPTHIVIVRSISHVIPTAPSERTRKSAILLHGRTTPGRSLASTATPP